MDVLSEKGRKSLNLEREAIAVFCMANPEYRFIETPKNRPAAVDGVFMKDGELNAVVEVKVRKMTRERLRELGDTWLVTMDKLERGRMASALLRVPFVGLLYLLPEKRLFSLPVTKQNGEWALEFERRETITQRTINGGSVKRENAFLPLEQAKEHK